MEQAEEEQAMMQGNNPYGVRNVEQPGPRGTENIYRQDCPFVMPKENVAFFEKMRSAVDADYVDTINRGTNFLNRDIRHD